MRDFTMEIFKKMCMALKHAGYEMITFSDYCTDIRPARFVILRHDVDKSPHCALEMARFEKEMNIRSSYYFRVVKASYDEKVIMKIAEMDHEVGYHYEDLTMAEGNFDQAIKAFEKNLLKLRQLYPVKTICMHGSPLSKWDNRKIWERYDYRTYGIIGEPYKDTKFSEILYLTDTGRTWNGAEFSVRDKVRSKESCKCKSTDDIIKALGDGELPHQLMLAVHPQRWHDEFILWLRELIWQSCKNVVKRNFLVKK